MATGKQEEPVAPQEGDVLEVHPISQPVMFESKNHPLG